MDTILEQIKKETQRHFDTYKRFENADDVYALEEAANVIDSFRLTQSFNNQERLQARRAKLQLWLSLLNLIDQRIDLNFDFNNVPQISVAPEHNGDSGIDPSEIKDSIARKKYKDQIESNRIKAETYRVQRTLFRFNALYSQEVDNFILENYTKEDADKFELNKMLEVYIEDNSRKDHIRNLFLP